MTLFYDFCLILSCALTTITFIVLCVVDASKRLKKLKLWQIFLMFIPTYIVCIVMYIFVPNDHSDIVVPFKIVAPILPIIFTVLAKLWFNRKVYYCDENNQLISEDQLLEQEKSNK